MSKENINELFTNLIRDKMTDKEFWNWTSTWFDPEMIIESAESWNNDDKKEVLDRYKAGDYKE